MTSSIFAQFDGDIYIVSSVKDNIVRLVSDNEQDIKKGFVEKVYPDIYLNKDSLPRLFIKEVDKTSLIELYKITWKIIYKNEIFELIKENKQDVIIGTPNAKLARKYKMDRVDKYYYEKQIPKNEVKIIKERKDLLL
ncbi:MULTISPECIES: hypothetical protein [Clostridia]|uniref:hypothetical protein n=1 Tax=Clostridia TaxID=186801 RepID=UPI000EA2A2A9|nr:MULTISPECIES: hypothetical protein [Clostridia]NBJ71640.1 hypothetical protein [Roseburia sp. 1XD42-34]RKI73991.1 hypothetical protein D7V87_19655 [Clostridium sp. 1xD42-85]